jgi:YbgC/YbaW family acyl-CoA thioester hydrolase
MGIVHHSNHARYFERGRVELLRLLGLEYTKVMEMGLHLPLTDMSLSFKRPLLFDEILLIETSVTEVSKARVTFAYGIFTADDLRGSLLSETAFDGRPKVLGKTEHCVVNSAGRPQEMPPALWTPLEGLLGK